MWMTAKRTVKGMLLHDETRHFTRQKDSFCKAESMVWQLIVYHTIIIKKFLRKTRHSSHRHVTFFIPACYGVTFQIFNSSQIHFYLQNRLFNTKMSQLISVINPSIGNQNLKLSGREGKIKPGVTSLKFKTSHHKLLFIRWLYGDVTSDEFLTKLFPFILIAIYTSSYVPISPAQQQIKRPPLRELKTALPFTIYYNIKSFCLKV